MTNTVHTKRNANYWVKKTQQERKQYRTKTLQCKCRFYTCMSLQKQCVGWDQCEVVEGEPVYFNIWAKSCVNKPLICVQQRTRGIYRTAQNIIYHQILIIIKWMKLMLFCHMYRMSKCTHLYCMPWRCRYLKEKFWLTFPCATMISSKSWITHW